MQYSEQKGKRVMKVESPSQKKFGRFKRPRYAPFPILTIIVLVIIILSVGEIKIGNGSNPKLRTLTGAG
jgi:hypothetical protein